eukprot:ANDGO_07743.mRNA.1 Trehalose synthase/amylase TreS
MAHSPRRSLHLARQDSVDVKSLDLIPDEDVIKNAIMAEVEKGVLRTPKTPAYALSPRIPSNALDEKTWYKDAIIYQIHIKSFFDSNGDGIGDFRGLTSKLDYLADLGITVIWILPFYPSPLKDDGYDISDYRSVHPYYGTMDDFKEFLDEAHRRGMRVVSELVINHTSDACEWFQRARRAPPGSVERDYYVWSDSEEKWPETRIIFRDFEKSNWTWDPVANSYYWHRFYSHQPDLNFDNPKVMEEVIDIMCYWLDMGVDGLRLDAIPYICERDGTNNENLPETHAVIKKLRKVIDERYGNKMLLAEANQWPEDTYHYFGQGSGDECHMAFHFPLMPRMYMSLAQEDRHPMTDILRQTPDIPADAQWALFLRNHDELTLEMVTEDERDYMWNFYASDPLARINLGIRRRLAPLMNNDRRKIELLNSMLFSMPGTPVIYYMDEIGGGDNFFLGDRHGCRTPMQWSPDRNGGFSRAEPSRLFLPVIQDSIYGYSAVNVESQARNPSSLLNWMRKIIEVRNAHRCFGRGSLELLFPGNRKIFAYVRKYESEVILCVCNLSRAAQAVELDLSQYKERVPVELLGRSAFPPIGDLPYLLTLPPYGFYWFILTTEIDAPKWHEQIPPILPDLNTLVLSDGWKSIFDNKVNRDLIRQSVVAYMKQQSWFAKSELEGVPASRIAGDILVRCEMPALEQICLLAVFHVSPINHQYFVPLLMNWDRKAATIGWPLMPFTIAKIRKVNQVGALLDGANESQYVINTIRSMAAGVSVELSDGYLKFWCTEQARDVIEEIEDDAQIRRFMTSGEHTYVTVGESVMLRTFRRVYHSVHPVVEVIRFLTDVAKFPFHPQLYGVVEYVDKSGVATTLGVCQKFIVNQGTGEEYFTEYLVRFIESIKTVPEDEIRQWNCSGLHATSSTLMKTMGRRVAAFHSAVNRTMDDPAWDPEQSTSAYLDSVFRRLNLRKNDAFDAVDIAKSSIVAAFGECPTIFSQFLETQNAINEQLKACEERLRAASTTITRIHGHLHLGHVLLTEADWCLFGMEGGEPAHTIAERRAKHTPIKDVASLTHSFSKIACSAFVRACEVIHPRVNLVIKELDKWSVLMKQAFLEGYLAEGVESVSQDTLHDWLCLFYWNRLFAEIIHNASQHPTMLLLTVGNAIRHFSECSNPFHEATFERTLSAESSSMLFNQYPGASPHPSPL